jgi:hypothetical protein
MNKRPLPKQACRNTESKRPLRRDVLQFGASTRLYCLQGPTELERGAKHLSLPLKKSQEIISNQEEEGKEIPKVDSVTTWRGLDRLLDPL